MVTFGLMAQNKDIADQAHRDMRLATIMICINTTHKMIELKMTMWERMTNTPPKNSLFATINLLMDNVEDLNMQLEAIGEKTLFANLIVLSILSSVAVAMGLKHKDSRKND
jgi:hypothetical protein